MSGDPLMALFSKLSKRGFQDSAETGGDSATIVEEEEDAELPPLTLLR
jgi:hypothetical protein